MSMSTNNTCERCGSPAEEQIYFGVQSFLCIFCGNCHYPAFPKRPAPENICDICGEEFKKRKFTQLYCPFCKKLIGKNISKTIAAFTKTHPKMPGSKPWEDRKLEAAI